MELKEEEAGIEEAAKKEEPLFHEHLTRKDSDNTPIIANMLIRPYVFSRKHALNTRSRAEIQ
jgi:hypothetical protein